MTFTDWSQKDKKEKNTILSGQETFMNKPFLITFISAIHYTYESRISPG